MGVHDASPLVRRAAARALSGAAPQASANTLAPLLNDRVRAVRIEAAEVLAGVPVDALPDGGPRGARKRPSTNMSPRRKLNSDRPEAHSNLAFAIRQEEETVCRGQKPN